MERELQDRFFGIFELGGIFDIARQVKSFREGKCRIDKDNIERWTNQFEADEIRLKQHLEDFDDGILITLQSPLMREIEGCLNDLNSIESQKRYITSIIIRLGDISNVLYPNTSHTDSKEIIQGALDRAAEYQNIYGSLKDDETSIETRAISRCIFLFNYFIRRLDALCLPYRIDIEELQNNSGIRLRPRRSIADIMGFVGSYDLAVKYLRELDEINSSVSEPDNIKPQESILKNKPEQVIMRPTPTSNDVKTYEYDPDRIIAVFKFCDGSVFNNVSAHQFGECVGKANFREIYNKKGTVKSKLKRSINKLSHILDNADWYKQAAQSIGADPSGCSGANVSEDWLRQLNALK